MPRGRPKGKKRGRRPAGPFDLSIIQAEFDAHRQKMIAPIDRRIFELEREIDKLKEAKTRFGGVVGARRGRPPMSAGSNAGPAAAATPARKGKRIRRNRADVEKHAQGILDFVKGTKGGVTGTQIKEKFGKVIGTVKGYVKQYTGVDLKSNGPKTSMRYTA